MYWYCVHHWSFSLFFKTILSLSSPPKSDVPPGPPVYLDRFKVVTLHFYYPIQSLPWYQQYFMFLAPVSEITTNNWFEIFSKDRTVTPTSSPSMVEDFSAFTDEPEVETMSTLAQFPLLPILVASDRSPTAWGGSYHWITSLTSYRLHHSPASLCLSIRWYPATL